MMCRKEEYEKSLLPQAVSPWGQLLKQLLLSWTHRPHRLITLQSPPQQQQGTQVFLRLKCILLALLDYLNKHQYPQNSVTL